MDIPEITITRSHDGDRDENKERGNWSNQFEFLLSCLSYAVGLGNVWRFPYLCYRNGGGAFLIPWATMLLVIGIPLFFLELAFGQYASEGPVTIWKVSPLFGGIGYAMFLMSGLVAIYYNMILAWAMFYLFASLNPELPWKSCDNWWNTDACRRFDTRNCSSHNGIMTANGTCIYNGTVPAEEYAALVARGDNTKMPSDEYFHNFVLGISSGIHELGSIRYDLAFCLLLCWVIVYLCLFRGVKSMGKVVYFTALFPYVVLTILLIRGATLPGAGNGILFYLTPEWHRLADSGVWADAAMQIFFSLSPCWGGLITLASYNAFHTNCLRDAISIAIGNCLTSFYAGFVIFSIIGFMAHELDVPVSQVAAQGAGLAFVAYPEAVSKLPISPLWSILFFVMLLTLGLGTQFTLIETVVTTIVDTYPERLRHRKALVLLCTCAFMFTVGLFLCTNGGMYVLQLMDNYCASFSALIIGLTEVIVISYVYGVDRFLEDIKCMLGDYPFPRRLWKAFWCFITPGIIIVLLFMSLTDLKPTSYGEYIFPSWTTPVGWMFTMIPISAIPLVAMHRLCSSEIRQDVADRFRILLQPSADWGPKLQIHRIEALSPKHTDSQVPLASHQYELDDDLDDMDNSREVKKSVNSNYRPSIGTRKRGPKILLPSGYVLANDTPCDTPDTADSDVGGIRLDIGGNLSPDSREKRAKLNGFTNETNF